MVVGVASDASFVSVVSYVFPNVVDASAISVVVTPAVFPDIVTGRQGQRQRQRHKHRQRHGRGKKQKK